MAALGGGLTQVERLVGVAHGCSDGIVQILSRVLGLESLFRGVAIWETDFYYEL